MPRFLQSTHTPVLILDKPPPSEQKRKKERKRPDMAQSVKQWVPLESNPYILTRFGRTLGLPPAVSFVDVWSLDLLDIVPQPCHAVVLLYPLTETLISAGQSSQQQAEDEEGVQSKSDSSLPYFCKQTISNACGTIALLHAALNADLTLTENSFLDDFRTQTSSMSPDERAVVLNESSSLDAVHSRFANVRHITLHHSASLYIFINY